MSAAAILSFRDEIESARLEVKAHTVLRIVFSTVARQSGLGSTAESADDKARTVVRAELAVMALAYLRHSD